MNDTINNIFVEVPNRETYEEYKSEISKNSLVFLANEDKVISNDKEYQFVSIIGNIALIDGNGNKVVDVPILNNWKLTSYGYGYDSSAYWLGDWDEPIINTDEL